MGRDISERLPDHYFIRDLKAEKKLGITEVKLYGYWEYDKSLTIVGQVFASKLDKPICFDCCVYDKDGDVVVSEKNDAYGSGLVNSYIQPECFFNGFPIRFNLYGPRKKKLKEIRIVPTLDY